MKGIRFNKEEVSFIMSRVTCIFGGETKKDSALQDSIALKIAKVQRKLK